MGIKLMTMRIMDTYDDVDDRHVALKFDVRGMFEDECEFYLFWSCIVFLGYDFDSPLIALCFGNVRR